jgi:hypothetical protein
MVHAEHQRLKIGVMEYWSIGVVGWDDTSDAYPLLQHSNTPLLQRLRS